MPRANVSLPFTSEEYERRLRRVRDEMAGRGINLLILSDPCNLYYLTGYDAWSFYVPQAVLVPLSDSPPVWVGRGADRNCALLTTWLPDDNIVGYPDNYVQSADRHPMQFIAKLLEERGWANGNIGVEKVSYYFGVAAYEALQGALPNAAFNDASLLVNQLRMVKSPAELDYIRQAGQIVEKTMRTAVDMIAPGVRQCDVAAEIYRSLMSGTESFGGTYASTPPLIPAGVRTSTPHLVWTDAPYQLDEPVNLELVACRLRYHAPIGRSVYVGELPEKFAQTAAIVAEGIEAALDTIRPGVVAEEVELAWRKVIARHGIEKESRCGYSFGIAYPPTFGELTVSLRPGDRTVLQAGMSLHFIPGLWLDGWGMVMTESLIVTDAGPERLTNLPREILVRS